MGVHFTKKRDHGVSRIDLNHDPPETLYIEIPITPLYAKGNPLHGNVVADVGCLPQRSVILTERGIHQYTVLCLSQIWIVYKATP